jgi:ADP-heptose:LPS heptosyltransferase
MDNKKIVLIIPYRGIGDLIFHLPLLRGLYKKYKSKIIIVTNSSNKAKFLLKNEASIKKIDYLNFEREKQIINSFLFLKKINSYKADICILTAPTKRLIIPLMLSNIKNKFFFKKSKIKDLSKYIISQSINIFGDIKFKKKYNLMFIKEKIFYKKIFLSIDSHHDQNNWKENNFIKLIDKILKLKNIKKVYINFSPNKIGNFGNILKKFFKNKKIFFTYKNKFSNIIKIINDCSYVIGNESGPACLGASMGKKVFSIYDPKYTPNLSSKIINKEITYFNSKKLIPEKIIKTLINKIN